MSGRGSTSQAIDGSRRLLLACALWFIASPCSAQSFALPVDVAQGLVFGADHPRTPYLFDVAVAPSLDLGAVRVGALLNPAYRNPRWDLGVGGRLSAFWPIAARELGLRFAVQGEYLPRKDAMRMSAGLVAEAFGLIRIGLWPAYETRDKHPELTFSVGTDVVSWIALFTQDSERVAEDY